MTSIALWPYLFMQYRKASLAIAEIPGLHESGAVMEALRPISIPPKPEPSPLAAPAVKKSPAPVVSAPPLPAVAVVVSASEPIAPAGDKKSRPEAAPAEKSVKAVVAPAPSKSEQTFKTGQTSPGGISPAMAYLQSLKTQIDTLKTDMEKVNNRLSDFTQKNETQFNAILSHLQSIKSNAPQPGKPDAQEESEEKEEISSTSVSSGSEMDVLAKAQGMEPEPKPAPSSGAESFVSDQMTQVIQIQDIPEPMRSDIPGNEPRSEPAGSQLPDPSLEQDSQPQSKRKGPVWPV